MTNQLPTVAVAAKTWSSSETRSGNSLQTLLDVMIANGATVETLKDKEHPVTVDCNRGIMASFGKTAVKLADTPTKELSKQGKSDKRHNRQQQGSRFSKIAKALNKRLNPDVSGPTPRKPDAQWLRKWFADGVKRVETSEGAESIDLVEVSEWLSASPLAPKE